MAAERQPSTNMAYFADYWISVPWPDLLIIVLTSTAALFTISLAGKLIQYIIYLAAGHGNNPTLGD